MEIVMKGSKRQPFCTMFCSELLGTALLMFVGCMGCVPQFDSPPATHHMVSITFGLVVMTIIQSFGHISGAHLNPAVTLASLISGQLSLAMAAVYIVAQLVGATLGYGFLRILLPEDYAPAGFCTTVIHLKITATQGLAIEITITTLLILVCCAVWDKRNADKLDSLPLRFGFVIAAISMAAGPLTGASMNTARSAAPLVFGGSWKDQWIYFVGPNIAAPLGCGLYKFIFSLSENEELSDRPPLNEVCVKEKM